MAYLVIMTTRGIKTSCNHKRQHYLLCKDSKDSNDISLIKYYKEYCKILSRVINEAKELSIIIKLLTLQIKLKQHGRL
jgi:hypothetical protein